MDFKLRLLKEYYESGSSMYGVSKKHGVDDVTFLRWVRSFESQSLSLPDDLSELENQVYMARNEVLEIGRERYGIDLLKKAGAKQ